MRNKKIVRLFTAMLAVVLCTTAFAVPASAGGGDGEPYYTETAGTEAALTGDAESPEVTVTDDEDTAGDDSADNNTEAGGDALDQITELLGGLGTVTVTEDGILFTPDTEKWETRQTGTVTTCGGNLNVRTGAGLDNDAFTQLPDGAQVEVIGTEGEWVKVLLPEREGYVHSDYLTITDTGSFSLSLDGADLSALLELLPSGLSDGGAALTPDGNLSLIDDLGGVSSGKQFITVETKGGNVFYLIIDRDDEGAQTVHFLNQVDEADLLALMEDGEVQETPAVCTCTEKCQAGAVNTACPVCAVNMSECAGKAPEEEPEPEPGPEKESGSGGALVLILLLAVLGGGGAFAYIKFIKPKQGAKVSADPDDYDFEDEEEYINEDAPEPEETEETK